MSQPPGPLDEQPEPVTPQGDRRSRILGSWHQQEGARGVLIALASTIVFFTVLGVLIVNAPGWDAFEEAFFNGAVFRESFPQIAETFVKYPSR